MELYQIRDAAPRDAAGIARVHVRSWQSSYRGILPAALLDRLDVSQRLAARQKILAAPDGGHFVAVDPLTGQIVGFCDAGANRGDEADLPGELYALYLVEEAQRRGLGTRLLRRAVEWLRGRRLQPFVVWVLADNQPARRFYEKRGGRPAGRKTIEIGGIPHAELAYAFREA